MVKKPSKRAWKWIVAGVAVAIVAFIGVKYAIKRKNALPEGIASGNGRIEGKLVDVSAKEPLRVKEILVDEGALVKPGQVLVRAGHRHAGVGAGRGQRRRPGRGGEAGGGQGQHRQAEERDRPRRRRGRRVRSGWSSRAPARSASWTCAPRRCETTKAGLSEVEAMLATATQNVEVARKNAATIQTRIDDATLRSPVTGRVLYRLAEPGEVLGAGRQGADAGEPGRHLHGDLPALRAGRGGEGRRRGAGHGRLRPEARGRRTGQLRLAGGAVHAQAGRDQERAREADVPREDPAAQGGRRPVHRADQDRRPRRRLRQGEGFGGLAGAPAEPGDGGPGGRVSTRRE